MTSRPAAPAGEGPGAVVEPEAAPSSPPAGGVLPSPCRAEHERWRRRLRLQRQLHDGAALRISALVPQLGVVRNRLPEAVPELQSLIDGLQDQVHLVLQELREVARAIYPPLLAEAGLGPALREFADRAEVPVRVVADQERFGPAVEGAAYFAVTECLGALPADGRPVEVVARREDGVLVVVLTGVPPRLAAAVLDQVCGLGGQVSAAEGSAAPTIVARIPCA
ncbi:MAG TPA: histidine kinase [Geodermatophilus sp.]|nr:histidine kinase [Geodermatophilus sp.]